VIHPTTAHRCTVLKLIECYTMQEHGRSNGESYYRRSKPRRCWPRDEAGLRLRPATTRNHRCSGDPRPSRLTPTRAHPCGEAPVPNTSANTRPDRGWGSSAHLPARGTNGAATRLTAMEMTVRGASLRLRGPRSCGMEEVKGARGFIVVVHRFAAEKPGGSCANRSRVMETIWAPRSMTPGTHA
jgi:hypothetical protein